MAKVNYEWQVGETDWGDDTEMLGFEPTPARPAPMRRLRHLPRRLVWLSSAATVLLLAVVGWRLWQGYQDGFTRVRRDIQATSDLEAWAWLNRDASLGDSLVSTNASAAWRTRATGIDSRLREWAGDNMAAPQVELSDLELQGNVALVRASVTLTDTATTFNAYSEMRFYERGDDGVWRRTSPDAGFWGVERRLASDHFQVTYRARDHAAVRAFLPRAEAMYAGLLRDLGLDPANEKPFKLNIVPTLDGATFRFSNDHELTLPSPLLIPTSQGYQPEDRLLRSLASPLAYYLVQRTLEKPTLNRDTVWATGRLALGISNWLAFDSAPLPTAWQAQLEADFRRELASGHYISLASLTSSYDYDRSLGRLYGSRMVAVSLADYIAATYGRDRLGQLLQALPGARNWDEVTATVLNISPLDLEDAWRAYIYQRYGVQPKQEAAAQ
ncbi:MAG: hypothetical protein KIT87_27120 [Anaerolineae bacterium]|nr:hypothetical protein [Anaerolineae bacterium]